MTPLPTSHASPPDLPASENGGASHRLVAAALMLGMFVSGLDTSIVNIILPTLQTAFRIPADRAMLLATVYLTVLAGFQLVFGRCADVFGPARVFCCGLVLFMSGSLGCALSTAFAHILSSRAVQGGGGAMMAASFGALILSDFPRDKTGSVLGAVITSIGCGTIVGPPLGGFLAEHASWRWVFLINIPVCLTALALFVRHRRAAPSPPLSLRRRLGRLDAGGAILSIVMFTALPLGVGALAEGRGASPRAGILFGLFVLGLTLFVAVERKAKTPLLSLSLFRDRGLDLLIAVKLALFVVLNGALLVFPFFLTRGMGLSASRTGLLMLTNAVAMALATPPAGRITDRRGGAGVMAVSAGLLLAVALGALLLPSRPPMAALTAVLILLGAAIAAVLVSSTALLLQRAPEGLEGVFSGMNALSMSVGGSLGLALFSYLYALGADGGQGAAAARGGFSTALLGLAAGSGLLLALVLFHVKTATSRTTPETER